MKCEQLCVRAAEQLVIMMIWWRKCRRFDSSPTAIRLQLYLRNNYILLLRWYFCICFIWFYCFNYACAYQSSWIWIWFYLCCNEPAHIKFNNEKKNSTFFLQNITQNRHYHSLRSITSVQRNLQQFHTCANAHIINFVTCKFLVLFFIFT